MYKYKCLDCGHEFEGDRFTNECPLCGSQNIKRMPGEADIPWKKIAIGVGAVIALILILQICRDNHITINKNVTQDGIIFKVTGVNETDLKTKYKIIVSETGRADFNQPISFNGITSTAIIYLTSLPDRNATYEFNFVERKSNLVPPKIKWDPDNTYFFPPLPTAPTISCSKDADCTTKKYTITIKVDSGIADYFTINGERVNDCIIYDIAPSNEYYSIIAYDTKNNLQSDPYLIKCSPDGVRHFEISETKIQETFNKVADHSIYVGKALTIINNNHNMRLSHAIDDCQTLEEALNSAFRNGKRYKVSARITHNDCADVIEGITLTEL